jgi:hypothetical protein
MDAFFGVIVIHNKKTCCDTQFKTIYEHKTNIGSIESSQYKSRGRREKKFEKGKERKRKKVKEKAQEI